MKKQKIDKKINYKVEKVLEKYPFWILRLDSIGLGSPSNYNVACGQENITGSMVENAAEYDEYIRKQVQLIEGIYDLLGDEEKELIDLRYFKFNSPEFVQNEMKICQAKYYRLRKGALEKFAISLGYIK